ncbi:TPA: tail fiber protein, partial [Enterobacter hormaechei]|nr:tail fiber protein [Enterobacter hormaechei]
MVQLSSATDSASETLAATPRAVKAAYDLANGKYTAQDATTAQKGIVQLSSATNSTS